MMRFKTILTVTLLAGIGITAWYGVTAAPAGAGLMAKQVCSLVHVSGFSANHAVETYIKPLLGPALPFMSLRPDPVRRQVSVSTLGFHTSTAVFHPGYGCVLLYEKTVTDIKTMLPLRKAKTPPSQAVDREHRRAYFDVTALRAAADTALVSPGTQAVLVLHQGHMVIERYADGVDGNTPLPGWSMAKTLTAVITGMLAQRNVLAVDEVALFKPWEEDERVHISLDQLLRMTSGINILENKTGADATSHLLFKTGDSTAYAIHRSLREPPGAIFDYTSGSTMLVARIISERLGGRPEALGFIRRELLDPLEMHHTLLEPDETGQFMGSSFVMSSAYDWGRFGMMLLQGGSYAGRHFVDADWIKYMTTPTPQATDRPYGAGVWLVDPSRATQAWAKKLPADTFYASGLQTNQLWVMPSRGLVIVRLGATNDFFKSGVIELLTAVLAAQLDPDTQSST